MSVFDLNLTLAEKIQKLWFSKSKEPLGDCIESAHISSPDADEIRALLGLASKNYKAVNFTLTGGELGAALTVHSNESGATITAVRVSAGIYDITASANSFVSGKVQSLLTNVTRNSSLKSAYNSTTTVRISVSELTITQGAVNVTQGNITDPAIHVTQGTTPTAVMTDPLITVDQGPPVTAAINNAAITVTPGTVDAAEITNPAIINTAVTVDNPVIAYVNTDTFTIDGEIRIYE